MKIHFLLGLVGLAIGFAAPGFAKRNKQIHRRSSEQLRAEAKKFDEAYNKNDATAVAAFYTEDGVRVTPHGSFHGRQAIEIQKAARPNDVRRSLSTLRPSLG